MGLVPGVEYKIIEEQRAWGHYDKTVFENGDPIKTLLTFVKLKNQPLIMDGPEVVLKVYKDGVEVKSLRSENVELEDIVNF